MKAKVLTHEPGRQFLDHLKVTGTTPRVLTDTRIVLVRIEEQLGPEGLEKLDPAIVVKRLGFSPTSDYGSHIKRAVVRFREYRNPVQGVS